MALLKFDVPHALSQEEARTRVKKYLKELRSEYKDRLDNLQEAWEGSTGRIHASGMGYEVSGNIEVSNSSVHISAEVPSVVLIFKSKIKKLVEQKAKEIFS
jgi:hypothetical protein